MNVLLITYSFPPAAGVGVLRAVSLAKYLPENGIHLDVLTTKNAAAVGHDARPLAELASTVTIHRTWTPDLPFALRKALKKLISRNRSAAPTPQAATQSAAHAKPARPNPLKQFVANLLLPDPQLGWVPFATHAARRIIRERQSDPVRQIEAVVLTVPPFSSVKVITNLRRAFPRLPLILDFRDEWLTTTLDLVSFNNNPRARRIARETESAAVHAASAVVMVTEAAVDELRKRYPELPADRFHCIPNGFDRPLTSSAPRKALQPREPITLTYIGTVYGSTDPTPVVEAILTLPPELRARLRLRFIGHIETPALRATLERLAAAGVTLELISFLPQSEALAYIDRTDYLLLITHDPINVAAKLYDYIASARPILAFVHPTGDVRRILDRTRAGWSASIQSPAEIAQLLARAIELDTATGAPHLTTAFQPDRDAIAAYHRRPLAAHYAALLRDLAGHTFHLAEKA